MKNPSKSFIHNAMFCRWAASGSSTTSWEHSPKTSHRVAVLLCFPNVLHFHLHIQDLREVTCSSATRFWWVQQEAEKLKSHTFLGILKVNSFSGCLRHYLRKEKTCARFFRFPRVSRTHWAYKARTACTPMYNPFTSAKDETNILTFKTHQPNFPKE